MEIRQGARVAVSGAGGFVGSALTRSLRADGVTVLRLVRREAEETRPRVAGLRLRRDGADLDEAEAERAERRHEARQPEQRHAGRERERPEQQPRREHGEHRGAGGAREQRSVARRSGRWRVRAVVVPGVVQIQNLAVRGPP